MPLLTCPNDNVAMQPVQRAGVELDICPQCRGVWLDRGELEKIMEGERVRLAENTRPDYRSAETTSHDRSHGGSHGYKDDRSGKYGREGSHGSDYGGKRRRPSIFDLFD